MSVSATSEIQDMDIYGIIMLMYDDQYANNNSLNSPIFTNTSNTYSTITWDSNNNMTKPTEAQIITKYDSIKSDISLDILKKERDILLKESDKYSLKDYPFRSISKRREWKNYRQSLRDITSQTPTINLSSFELGSITFPSIPSDESDSNPINHDTTIDGSLLLTDSDNSHYVGFKAATTISPDLTWTLPSTDGTSGQFLKTDGSGTLSWSNASSGGGAISSIGNFSDNRIITASGSDTLNGEANLLFDGTDLTIGGTGKIEFNGANSGEHIYSSTNNQLDIVAQSKIDLTAPTIGITSSTALTATVPNITIDDPGSGKPILTLKSTHTTSTSSGELQFLKDAVDTEDNEVLGKITFYGEDEGNNITQFAEIVSSIRESDQTDEAGILELKVAESDGTNTAVTTGFKLTGSKTTDGLIDVNIGSGTTSTTTVAGDLTIGGNLSFSGGTTTNKLLKVDSYDSIVEVNDILIDSTAMNFGGGWVSNGITIYKNAGIMAIRDSFRIYETTVSNGNSYIRFKSPDSLATNYTLTLPAATGTLATIDTSQTFTGKTISSGTLTGSLTAGGGTGTSGQVL